jgi:hypothetical protein
MWKLPSDQLNLVTTKYLVSTEKYQKCGEVWLMLAQRSDHYELGNVVEIRARLCYNIR